ncbi:BTAD domain-containing putative transcriptional regulator [Marinactinospora rubrisoli]|uniref:BTAD domain-containing putative transcriptional regulator n=1 Tax=Marinactinospora rubrisoli TaxID=2715399 RepID=A0ABW2KBH4_9ACTN
MRFSILGPVTVHDDAARAVAVGGARLRALLVLLLLDPGRTVGTERLIEGIWGGDAPAGAGNALQALVSRLRRLLGAAAPVVTDAAGYRLDIDPGQVDLWEFQELVERGRAAHAAGRPREALRALDAALALWNGPLPADLAGLDELHSVLIRLGELRNTAVEKRLAAALDLGRHAEVLPDAEALAAEWPLREQRVRLLMRALAGCGRQADALAAYEALRRRLAGEFGTDPAAETRELHLRLLRGELDPAPAVPGGPGTAGRGAAPTRLPSPLTSFVGRDTELRDTVESLRRQRLVTLIGPGGAGKTRLSIEAGSRFAERHAGLAADGVWFVELASLSEAGEVAQAVLGTLGLRERAVIGLRGAALADDPLSRLTGALAGQRVLLVLDNCEHLVTEVARFTERLVAECPRARVLATSREPLSVPGERLVRVSSLALPPKRVSAERALDYPSVRLFAERAAAAGGGFRVHAGNVAHVARVCRELDGMPLALELAAARVRAMPLPQLAARLSDRFRLLTSGSRSALPRHQTLRAVVDWSWDLLGARERALLRRLSVFAGGATLEAVERVCADSPGGAGIGGQDVWEPLFALVDKSLVVADEAIDATAAPRYRMLETVRAYGARRLAEAGEADSLRRAHAEYVLDLWRDGDPRLRTGEQAEWLPRLRAEHDNLNAALRWAVDQGATTLALDIAHHAQWYWAIGDTLTEGGRWSAEIVRLAGDHPPDGRLVAYAECLAARTLCDLRGPGSPESLGRALDVLRAGGERAEEHPYLLMVPVYMGMLSGEIEKTTDHLAGLPDHPDPWQRAFTAALTGVLAAQCGRTRLAERRFRSALDGFRALGDAWGGCQALAGLAEIAHYGDFERERELLTEGVVLAERLGLRDHAVMFRGRLAVSTALSGDTARAREQVAAIREAGLKWQHRLSVTFIEAQVDRLCGDLPAARGKLAAAMRQAAEMGEFVRTQAFPLSAVARARVELDAGDTALARRLLSAAWHAPGPLRDSATQAAILEQLAELAIAAGEPESAARLLGHADGARGVPNRTVPAVLAVRDAARARLGEARFTELHRRAEAATGEERAAAVERCMAARPEATGDRSG